MAFFKKATTAKSRSKSRVSDLIPQTTLALVEDVDQMEEKTHTMQRALKKYASARKDESVRLAKLTRLADTIARHHSLNYNEDVEHHIMIEKDLRGSIQVTGLDPIKSYCKLFPTLNGVTSSLIRLAIDHQKAVEKNRKSRGDPKTAANVERTKSELEAMLARAPPGLEDVLDKTQTFFATAACAAIQAQAIYHNAVASFIDSNSWALSEAIDTKTSASSDLIIAKTEDLLSAFQDISVVRRHKPRESRDVSRSTLSPMASMSI